MAAQTLSNLSNVLRETWIGNTVAEIVLEDTDVFLGMINKEKFTGGTKKLPVRSQRTTDAGTYTFASTFKGGSTYLQWQISKDDMAKGYNLVARQGDALYLARENEDAFLIDLATEMKSAFSKTTQTMNIQSYLGVDPIIGTIDSTTTLASTSLVLTNADDIVNFEVGDKIQLLDANSSSALLDSADYLTIAGKVVATKTLTVDKNISEISGAETGDYIIKCGYNDDGYTGLASWLPTSTPSSTAYYNIDRSTDRVAYAGSVLNATGLNITDAIFQLASDMYKYSRTSANGKYKLIMNQAQKLTLEAEIAAKSYYTKPVMSSYNWGGKVVEGVSGVGLNTAIGMIECYAGKYCPVNYGYLIRPEDWTLYHIGPDAPMILNPDGLDFRAVYNDDVWEARIGHYSQIFCKDIQRQGVLYNLGA